MPGRCDCSGVACRLETGARVGSLGCFCGWNGEGQSARLLAHRRTPPDTHFRFLSDRFIGVTLRRRVSTRNRCRDFDPLDGADLHACVAAGAVDGRYRRPGLRAAYGWDCTADSLEHQRPVSSGGANDCCGSPVGDDGIGRVATESDRDTDRTSRRNCHGADCGSNQKSRLCWGADPLCHGRLSDHTDPLQRAGVATAGPGSSRGAGRTTSLCLLRFDLCSLDRTLHCDRSDPVSAG